MSTYLACTSCRRLFSSDGNAIKELSGPIGVRVRCQLDDRVAVDEGYRGAAPRPEGPVITLARPWRNRWALPAAFASFVTLFLLFWGGTVTLAALGLIGGNLQVPVAQAGAVGLLVLGIAAAVGYLSAALWLNSTIVAVSPKEIICRRGPVSWGPPIHWERRPGDRAIVCAVQENDVRNLGARWPTPTSHQVRLSRRGNTETEVLVVQITKSADAEAIRDLLAGLLAATEENSDRPLRP